MTLTPERIREALVANEGWRYAASIELGITADRLRILMRRYQDQGHQFPKAKNRRFVEAKTTEILQPGQWVEAGQGQEFGEIVERKGGRLLVRFTEERAEWRPIAGLTWVPSGGVIAEGCREIQAKWTERDFGLRNPLVRRKWFVPFLEAPGEPREEIW